MGAWVRLSPSVTLVHATPWTHYPDFTMETTFTKWSSTNATAKTGENRMESLAYEVIQEHWRNCKLESDCFLRWNVSSSNQMESRGIRCRASNQKVRVLFLYVVVTPCTPFTMWWLQCSADGTYIVRFIQVTGGAKHSWKGVYYKQMASAISRSGVKVSSYEVVFMIAVEDKFKIISPVTDANALGDCWNQCVKIVKFDRAGSLDWVVLSPMMERFCGFFVFL